MNMNRLKGKSVHKGIALGKIYIVQEAEYKIKKEQIQDVEAELNRVYSARNKAAEKLQMLCNKAQEKFGRDVAELVQVQISMLEDDDYWESIEGKIASQHMNAEYAVWETGVEYAEVFSTMDNDYMTERSLDIRDITNCMIGHLCNFDSIDIVIEPAIIVANDLSLNDMLLLDESKILAFVAAHGSTNPYIALLAKKVNVPALVEVDMDLLTLVSGTEAAVDGFVGEFVLEPDENIKNAIISHIEE